MPDIVKIPYSTQKRPSSLFLEALGAISCSLEVINTVPCTPPLRVADVLSSALVLLPQTPNLGYPY